MNMAKNEMKSRNRMGRRGLLKGLGAAAAALPFLSRMPVSAEAATPKVIFFGTPNGFLVGPDDNASRGYAGWRPPGFSGSEGALASALPGVFAPLTRHRDDLVFVEGLTRLGSMHQHRVAGSALTGRPIGENSTRPPDFYATGISLDQFIAARAGATPLTTAFNVGSSNSGGERYYSYLGANRPVTPIQNPRDAFDRVFAGATSDPVAERRTIRRRRLLDLAGRDLATLERRVPSADRDRVRQHIASIDALDRELTEGGIGASCAAPTRPGDYDFLAYQSLPQVIRQHSAVVARALACGYTNTATIMCGNTGGRNQPQWPEYGINSSYWDHAISHVFQGIPGPLSEGLSQGEAVRLGLAMQTAYNDLFANLLDELANLEDVDGSRVLDNTLVIHFKGMAENHSSDRLMWLLAGGRNLGVRGGRLKVVGPGGRGSDARHIPDFLTGILQTVGLTDVDTFGDPAFNGTPIDFG